MDACCLVSLLLSCPLRGSNMMQHLLCFYCAEIHRFLIIYLKRPLAEMLPLVRLASERTAWGLFF